MEFLNCGKRADENRLTIKSTVYKSPASIPQIQ